MQNCTAKKLFTSEMGDTMFPTNPIGSSNPCPKPVSNFESNPSFKPIEVTETSSNRENQAIRPNREDRASRLAATLVLTGQLAGVMVVLGMLPSVFIAAPVIGTFGAVATMAMSERHENKNRATQSVGEEEEKLQLKKLV